MDGSKYHDIIQNIRLSRCSSCRLVWVKLETDLHADMVLMQLFTRSPGATYHISCKKTMELMSCPARPMGWYGPYCWSSGSQFNRADIFLFFKIFHAIVAWRSMNNFTHCLLRNFRSVRLDSEMSEPIRFYRTAGKNVSIYQSTISPRTRRLGTNFNQIIALSCIYTRNKHASTIYSITI